MKKLLLILFFTIWNNITLDCQLNNVQNINNRINVSNQMVSDQYYFIENKGQWDDQVLFMAQSKSLRTWITKNSIVFEQFEKSNKNELKQSINAEEAKQKKVKAHAVGLEFLNPSFIYVKKGNPGHTKYNFIIGNDQSKHKSGVLQYSDVSIENIYEGIDMRYYFDNGELRYDFIVKPGANPDLIEMEIKGSDNFYIKDGDIVMETSLEPIKKNGLNAYQDHKLNKVECSFKLSGNKLKFEIGNYDRSKVLVIDPLTLISTKIIKSSEQERPGIRAIDVDSDGDVYFAGSTEGPNFPATLGTYQGGDEVIIGKIDGNLSTIEWMTFFGGSGNDWASTLQVTDDYIYFFGVTWSPNYPVSATAYQKNLVGKINSYFTVLNLNGETYAYSTRAGNSGAFGGDMVVSASGNVYITDTHSKVYSFTEYKSITSQTKNPIAIGSFISGFEPDNSMGLTYNLLFASKFSGNGNTFAVGIDVDANENIYITGNTMSADVTFGPTANAYDVVNSYGNWTFFVTKLHLGVNNLLIDYNSFFAQPSQDIADTPYDILWADGKMIFGGFISSSGLPTVNAFDNTFNSSISEGFLSAIEPNSNGTNDLVYSSYFGGTSNTEITAIDYDDTCDKVIVIGITNDSISGYTGTLNLPYDNVHQIFVGVVDVNSSGTGSLNELGYLHERYGNGLKIKSGSNIIYAGGYKFSGTDFILHKLYKENCLDSCECPEDRNSWLKLVRIYNSQSCDEGQCYVSNTITIPEAFDCYTHYYVYDGSQYSSVTQLPQNGELNYINRCINGGTGLNITVYLMEGAFDQNPCPVVGTIACGCDCPEGRNDWLELIATKGGGECSQYSCDIDYEFKIPSEYNCFTHYYIERWDDGLPSMTMIYPFNSGTIYDEIIGIKGCIAPGTELIIKMYLLRSELDTNPCLVEQTVTCPCDCPPERERNSWLELFIDAGAEPCDSNQCRVTHKLSDSIPGCYSHYQLETLDDDSSTQSSIRPLGGPNVLGIDRCIQKGERLLVKIKLYKGESDTVPCEIQGMAYCPLAEELTPCSPDCFSSTWTQRKPLVVELADCPGCFIRISYLSRIACPDTWNWKDIQITSIEKFNGGDGSPYDCDDCSDSVVYRNAVNAVILKNEMGFPPKAYPEPCSYIWRVVSAACWAVWEYYEYDDTLGVMKKITVQEKCESDCCVRQMMVCRNSNGSISVTDLGALTNDPACSGIEIIKPFDTLQCEGICHWLDGIYDVYGKQGEKIIDQKIKKILEKNPANKSLKLQIQQNETFFRVTIDEAETDKISVNISSLIGVNVRSITKNISTGLNMFEIDISDLISGIYVYNITADGVIIKSGKFNIVK